MTTKDDALEFAEALIAHWFDSGKMKSNYEARLANILALKWRELSLEHGIKPIRGRFAFDAMMKKYPGMVTDFEKYEKEACDE